MSAHAPLVISHPEWQTSAQRTIFGALTMVVWAVWIYLWLPLVTALLWVVGVHSAYVQIFRGTRGIGLDAVAWIALAVFLIVLYWSSFNRIRYRDRTRRRWKETVTKPAVGKAFGITESATLALLSRGRRLNLYFSDAGDLIRVDRVRDLPPAAAASRAERALAGR